MKQSRLFTAIIIALLGAMVIGCSEPKSVTFPDENLEAAIRDALRKPAGEEITPEELAGLIKLKAVDKGIADLSGLEYCTKLHWLYLGENQISDISPLSKRTNLYWLSLGGNQISDISPLSNLTSLIDLSLSKNQISDISPLSKLTNLTSLSLSSNDISDISPLVENIGLGEGDEVWLQDNNLDLSVGSEDMENIKALEDRGVVVHSEEQSPEVEEDLVGFWGVSPELEARLEEIVLADSRIQDLIKDKDYILAVGARLKKDISSKEFNEWTEDGKT